MALSGTSHACGPYSPIIPTPEYFGLSRAIKSMDYYFKEENLHLWQELTSAAIPTADIEKAVYSDSMEDFWKYTGQSDYCPTSNKFYTYLHNTADAEIIDFLNCAKRLEECRDMMNSPWYYPRYRTYPFETDNLVDVMVRCKTYTGHRLRDRYALQMTRALFANLRYDDCIQYVDSAFADISDSNLMKRMALRYVAGCRRRLGDTQRADSLAALTGDVWSVSDSVRIETMARLNPAAPQLIEYIRANSADSALMRRTLAITPNLLTDRRVKSKGDWHFMRAYAYNELDSNPSLARKEILKAVSSTFSSAELKDLARAYKMKLDAQCGVTGSLLADLRWIEKKIDTLDYECLEWIRRIRNIIYEGWVPKLWQSKDYSTAILLCAYADNLIPSIQGQQEEYYYDRDASEVASLSYYGYYAEDLQPDDTDYSCLSFQLMESLTSRELSQAYRKIRGNSPIYKFLRRLARTDRDYYYELIGTIALREENYARAEEYLSMVSPRYVKTMNVYEYLGRDPFKVYPTRYSVSSYGNSTWTHDNQAAAHTEKPCATAKLDFARSMRKYKKDMANARGADKRGMARLMYAIGRRNSFEECWALTQYWRGSCSRFTPVLKYCDDSFGNLHYGFLYDYRKSPGQKATENLYDSEVKAALAMMKSDETKAEAHLLLGNRQTLVKLYGNTSSGREIKSSCDNWRDWL